MYQNVDAVMDMPTYIYWQEIQKQFPDSKVILVERDADKWYRSVKNMMEIIDKERFFPHWIRYNFFFRWLVKAPLDLSAS